MRSEEKKVVGRKWDSQKKKGNEKRKRKQTKSHGESKFKII
jgi:hypothetical protein